MVPLGVIEADREELVVSEVVRVEAAVELEVLVVDCTELEEAILLLTLSVLDIDVDEELEKVLEEVLVVLSVEFPPPLTTTSACACKMRAKNAT